MFRRMFWFLTGAATGVWATTKVNRVLRRLTPDSLAASAADRALETGARLRVLPRTYGRASTQRESELQDALGLTGSTAYTEAPTELPAPRRSIAYNRKDEH